jgi:AcrR family transcriptional regulator
VSAAPGGGWVGARGGGSGAGGGGARPGGRGRARGPRRARAGGGSAAAALDLLAEGRTVDTLAMEAVAARAGVGKATIYRRWPGKEDLVVDAIRTMKGPLPEPAGESVRDDLLLLLRHSPKPRDERTSQVMTCLIPQVRRNPAQHRVYQSMVEPRRELMRQVLRRGIQTGELRGDLDIEVALTVLTAPLLLQRMLNWHPGLDEESLPERVVDTVLAGLVA